jgi:asparagine synthase (glutamine-hydrolysing)
MNLFGGIFNKLGLPVARRLFQKISVPHPFVDIDWIEWNNNKGIALLLANNINKRSTEANGICQDKDFGLILCGEVVLYNKDKLLQALNISAIRNDHELVLAAYKEWGKESVRHILGEFSFTIWDEKEQQLFCARDQIGHIPFFYCDNNQFFLFSNKLQVLSSFSCCSGFNEDWIIDFLLLCNSYKDKTVFSRIEKLPPGHLMIIGKDKFSIEQYWNLDKISSNVRPVNIKEAIEGLRSEIDTAIKLHLPPDKKIGIELSGGIDSGGIAAIAQPYLQRIDKSLVAFTNVLPESYKGSFGEFSDEWKNASLTASYLNIREHIIIDRILDDTLKLIDRQVDILGYPTNSFMTLFQEATFYKAQKSDVSVLLSGFGGNEVITEYANVHYLISLLRENKIAAISRLFRARSNNFLTSYARTAFHYLKFRLGKKRNESREFWAESLKKFFLDDKILNDNHIKRHYFSNIYDMSNLTLREKTELSVSHAKLSERIEIGKEVAALYGVKYCFPFLYVPLLEYYYHLPDLWKAIDTRGRGLYRQALKDTLPAEIIFQWKRAIVSATVPFYKIEFRENFGSLKEWCLALPLTHEIYNYISREKISKAADVDDKILNYQLKSIVMLAMFMDKQKNRKLIDIKELYA